MSRVRTVRLLLILNAVAAGTMGLYAFQRKKAEETPAVLACRKFDRWASDPRCNLILINERCDYENSAIIKLASVIISDKNGPSVYFNAVVTDDAQMAYASDYQVNGLCPSLQPSSCAPNLGRIRLLLEKLPASSLAPSDPSRVFVGFRRNGKKWESRHYDPWKLPPEMREILSLLDLKF